jgi:hypothetical protein
VPPYGPEALPGVHAAPWTFSEAPGIWIAAIVVGFLVSALAALRSLPEWLRALAFVLGQTIALTTPLAAVLDRWVYGAFPTIDKAGSLRFYLDGVHRHMLTDPAGSLHDPAAHLIGVQFGHLWVTELFDLVLSPFGAMNAQALLYPAFAWWAASRLCVEAGSDPRAAILAGFPFGLGLHVFRDLHWYTIEKAAVGWLALYAWLALRAIRTGRGAVSAAIVLAIATWMNLYLGLVAGAMAFLGTIAVTAVERERTRSALAVLALSFLFVLPLAIWQLLLLRGDRTATPDQYLWERAALDAFTLRPLAWDRIEAWRALDPLALVAAVAGIAASIRSRWTIAALAGAFALFVVALGPFLLPSVANPLYMAVRDFLPGFWRVAKPEVFFEGVWLVLLVFAARGFGRIATTASRAALVYAAMVVVWLGTTRAHPAFPGFSLPQEIRPVADWQQGVLQ